MSQEQSSQAVEKVRFGRQEPGASCRRGAEEVSSDGTLGDGRMDDV
jgi:hypothetical protein